MGAMTRIREVVRAARPADPEFAAALARRWAELPETARTPGQLLGRHAVGCEGTHGVFPQCDLACTPCYHSRDANQVRVDGPHTLAQVRAQMGLLRDQRGPRAHAQLIGGEVTLLDPDDHAAALAIMRAHGREPMSFTHGDIDYDYLEMLVLGPGGRPRLRRVSFAAHFDSLMFGRRGLPRPPDEASLNPYRQAFAAMFARLRREHGVRYFLAHSMTVTPANLGQVAGVVRDCRVMGYGMFSFQPAAFVGDQRRWHEDYRDVTGDQVWTQIERGAGTTLDYRVFEHGDVRCNRAAYGFWAGDRWYPFLDGSDPGDLAVRDAFFRYFGPVNFTGTPAGLLAVRIALIAARHPRVITLAAAWAARALRRVGLRRLLARRVRPVSYVMHQFMDAVDVTPAWELMQRGQASTDPRIRATQERLAACHYAMAHPEDGTLVPACVQHCVLDPQENRDLRVLLPLPQVPRRRAGQPGAPVRGRRAGALGAGNAGFAAESDAGPGPGHGRPAAGRRRGSTGGADRCRVGRRGRGVRGDRAAGLAGGAGTVAGEPAARRAGRPGRPGRDAHRRRRVSRHRGRLQRLRGDHPRPRDRRAGREAGLRSAAHRVLHLGHRVPGPVLAGRTAPAAPRRRAVAALRRRPGRGHRDHRRLHLAVPPAAARDGDRVGVHRRRRRHRRTACP